MKKMYVRTRPSFRFAFVLIAFSFAIALARSQDTKDRGSKSSTHTRLSAPPGSGAVPESINKLINVRVPMLTLLIAELQEEGMSFNMINETLSEPVFHSVDWDYATRILLWRFWVAPEGRLMDSLRAVSRAEAIALLKDRVNDLAVLVGLEPVPDLGESVGMLTSVRISTHGLLSEEEMVLARQQLAGASVIQLASPHPEGPILLARLSGGFVVEQPIEPAAQPVPNTTVPSKRSSR